MRARVAAAVVAAVAGSIAVSLALGTEWDDVAGVPPAAPAPRGTAPGAPQPGAVAGSTLGERAALMDEAECLAEGGRWDWVNAFFKACVLTYPDAGTACSSSAECEGGCFAHDFGSLEAGTGTCRANTDRSGCMGEVGGSVIECLHDDIMVQCTRDSTERECDGLR